MSLTIESIETIPIRVPLPFTYKGSYYKMRNRCTIITRITTSEGIVGEAYNADEDEPLQSEILAILHDELKPAVLGLDAFGTERVWEAMLPATFDQLRPRWYAMQAMACIDTAVWLNGRLDSVCALTETFVKERKHNLTGKMEPVGIDDACVFMGKFENGSLANFESTRYARGHKALYTFEINGENMSLFWDLHDLHRLQVFDYRDEGAIRGWKSVHVTDNSPDHPYMANWWVPGLAIGYDASFTHQVADFIQGLETGKPASPTFRDAYETQLILDAILDSAKGKKWVTVPKG